MSGTKTNLRIGDMDHYLDLGDGVGERYLGYTKGGGTLAFKREFEDLTADQFGTAPLEMALKGQDLTYKANLAEVTKQNIGAAIPEGNYAPGIAGDSKFGFGRSVGLLMSTVGGLLRMHPRSLPDTNRNEDIYIWKAVSMETVELNFKIDEQRVLAVTWRALIDDTQPEGYKLGRIGDNTIS